MPIRQTSRGLNVFAEFCDTVGNTVKVQESSCDVGKGQCIWLTTTDRNGNEFTTNVVGAPGGIGVFSPHLDREGARKLIAALQEFIGTDD